MPYQLSPDSGFLVNLELFSNFNSLLHKLASKQQIQHTVYALTLAITQLYKLLGNCTFISLWE